MDRNIPNSANISPSLSGGIFAANPIMKEAAQNPKELDQLVSILSNKLAMSARAARQLLYKISSSGQGQTYTGFKDFADKLIAALESNNKVEVQQLTGKQIAAEKQGQATSPAEANSSKDLATLLVKLNQINQNSGNIAKQQWLQNANINQIQPPQAIAQQALSQLVSSPQTFASWLVGNKTAFASLKGNPKLTYLLMALANNKIPMSPALMARLVELLGQAMKLKQGKGGISKVEDDEGDERTHDAIQEAIDHEHTVVDGVKNVINDIPVKPLRDFLIEAERFAEEEVANMWSIALKKERELEKQVLKQIYNFMHPKAKQQKPPKEE